MANELKDICNRLEGYSETGWHVLKAERTEDGTWTLVVKAPGAEKPEVAENVDDK